MTAKTLAQKFGKRLIGRKVVTERYGDWPGGPAEVIEMQPDPEDPAIVFQVRHLHVADPEDRGPWEIGVFGHEHVILLGR